MPFTYRDRPKLSDRLRGKSGEEILNEMKCDLDNERRMFFDSPWRARHNNSGFPRGFPFDDYPSRTNVRSYLNELASRHPEFADQLKEPPWSDDFVNPSPSSFGNARRPPPTGGPPQPNPSTANPDSGGDPRQSSSRGRSNLNQFGLRNTVPLGQSANADEQRRQRSMSAPPDNRASDKPKRFISKCEIPIMQPSEEQQQQNQQQTPPPPTQQMGSQPQTPQQTPSQTDQTKASNTPTVRLIPIQVEGRDEPIINKDVDTSTNFASEKFPHEVPSFEARLPRDFGSYQKHSPRFAHKEKAPPPPMSAGPQPKAPCHAQPEPTPMPMPMPMPMPAPEPPARAPDETDSAAKPAEAKSPEPPAKRDPLAKVGQIQKEVDELKQQVEAFDGKSRTDKQFMMLDELLTRKLISLDDIDTEGKEDVRQARKDTIRSIQRCISLLESRVPTADGKGGGGGGGSASDVTAESTALVPVDCMELDRVRSVEGGEERPKEMSDPAVV